MFEVGAVFVLKNCPPKELRGGPMKEKQSLHMWPRAPAVCTTANRTRGMVPTPVIVPELVRAWMC